MSSARIPNVKIRTATESRTITAQAGLDSFGSFVGAAWYTALTKLSKPLFNFFISNQQYFFLVTLTLFFINLTVYAVNFANAANKNAGKTANLAYRAFTFTFYLLIIGSAILFGPSVASVMYFTFCVIDPLLNTLKSFYFWIKCLTAKTMEEKEFFYRKTMEAVKYAIGGALFGVAMVVLFSVAGLPLFVTAIIGIVFTAISILLAPVVRPWFFKGIEKIVHFFKRDTQQEVSLVEKHDSIPNAQVHLNDEGFYSHSYILKHLKPDVLLEKMAHLRAGLEFTSKPRSEQTFFDKLFSEHPKRRNKLLALALLEDVLSKLDRLPDGAVEQPLTLSDGEKKHDFYYADKNEFVEKFHQHVVHHYPGAYQSWHKDVGRVQSCINQGLEMVVSCQGKPAPAQ